MTAMTAMPASIRAEVLLRLGRDFGLQHVAGTQYLRKGRCPAPRCGQQSLYSFYDAPWMLICGRPQKCDHRIHVKELYSDLFNDWSKTAPVSAEQPCASAEAYLSFARGFRLELIDGWFSQENYWSREQAIGSATVRFALDKGGYWERLIDQPERFGKQKARFKPGDSYKGVWWQPPSIELADVKELWIVEGIFDAIALLHHGLAAVAMLSCAPFPEQSLNALLAQRRAAGQRPPKLVWALDNEPLARANNRRFAQQASALGFSCSAALIPQPAGHKRDWNDLHLRWAFIEAADERAQRIARDLLEARHHGALLLAETAEEKGLLLYDWAPKAEFAFAFKRRLYWFKLDLDKYDRLLRELESSENHADQLLNDRQRRDKALRQCGAVRRIANCDFRALYYMRNELTDEAWYYFKVERPDGVAIKSTFSAAQLASAPEFKKRLLSVCNGAMYTGSASQLERMLEPQLERLKTVNTLDWVGYSREHRAYIFNDLAIAGGQLYRRNSEDFFDIGALSIKSHSQSPQLAINPDLNAYQSDWFELFWHCFGVRGAVVLVWWLGALHAEQIRLVQKSYLFLELVGEAGSGKSTLVEFLWKLLGRSEYEGFDPSKATAASRARNFAQVGNLPVVLIESEREQKDGAPTKHYDWDELKTAYNGRSVRSTGVKNNGNETREPPFRGALLIAQNNPVNASEPILQRLGHVHLSRDQQTPASKRLAEQLERMPIERLSGFLIKALQCEPAIVALLDARTSDYEQQLLALPGIRTVRIAKNHAQLRSLVDALALVLPLSEVQQSQLHTEIDRMAVERQQAINADPREVAEFWEVYDYLESIYDEPMVNHSKNTEVIAINLNEFAERAAEHKQKLAEVATLRNMLRNSRSRPYIDSNRAVDSAVRAALNRRNGSHHQRTTTVKCWIFKNR